MTAALAFRNVLRNKERSLLTLAGVVLAIGSFVALVSLAAGFTQRVERELGSREVHIYVVGGRSSTLPVSPLSAAPTGSVSLPLELQDLMRIQGVRTVTPILRTSLDGTLSVVPVLALPFDEANVVFKGAQFEVSPRDLAFEFARATTEEPEAEPETKTESKVSEKPPRELYPLLVGQGLRREIDGLNKNGVLAIDEIPFKIAGEMASHGFLDYMILAPIEAFYDQRSDRGVHEYWITLDDESQVSVVQGILEREIDTYLNSQEEVGEYAGARNIRVLNRREYLRSAQDYLSYGWILQVAVSMVGVLIAVTASMNTMLMSTYERLGEYATMRAVGASRQVISMTIIFEAIFLNVTGGLIGLLFGYLATGVLDRGVSLLLEIPYPMAGVTPALLLQALALSFGVGLVGAIIPCFIVSRIDLVAQLRKGL